jgi:GUN4-like
MLDIKTNPNDRPDCSQQQNAIAPSIFPLNNDSIDGAIDLLKLGKTTLALIAVSVAILLPVVRATAQETSSEFTQLQTLLEAKRWDDADRETVSILRNDPSSCRNLRAINRLWMQHSNNKYGLTPQLEIWQQAGKGLNCQTCESEIKEFSEKVGWKL